MGFMNSLLSFKKYDIFYNRLVCDDTFCQQPTSNPSGVAQLVLCVKGNFSCTVDNKSYSFNPNDLLVIAPLKHFSFKPVDTDNYEIISVNFSIGKTALDLSFVNSKNEFFVGCKSNIVNDVFKKMEYYIKTFDAKLCADVLRCLIKEVICNVHSYVKEQIDKPIIASQLISTALGIIDKNLFKIKNISEISNQLFIAENYFYHVFKKQMNKSPKQYIIERRLLVANDLIEMGKKPTEIYQKCGFNTYTTFYRSYLAYFGYPPSSQSHEKHK